MTASIGFDIFAKDRASDTFDKIGKHADQSGSKMSRLGGHLKTVGKIAALGLAGGAVIAGKALFDMAKNAAEDEAGQRRLAVALHNTAGATKGQVAQVESWISKMGVATGVTDDEMRPSLQKLVQATGSISQAQGLMKVALDASAGSGKSLESVTTALSKAQNGNMGALSRLGIQIKNADGSTRSFHEVVKDMAHTFQGQSAAAANSFDGKMKRLQLVFDETKESIGAALLPMLTNLGTWFLTKGVPAISKVWSWLSEKLGPVFKTVGSFISDHVVPAVQKMVEQFQGASGKTGALSKAFQDLKPFLSLVGNILSNVVGPALKWVASVIIPLAIGAFGRMAKALGLVGEIGIWLWNKALAPTFRFIVTGVGQMMTMWGKMLSALGHVPGFGWAKSAGQAMTNAGADAVSFANKIKAIPNSHTTDIGTRGLGAATSAVSTYRAILDRLPRYISTQIVTQHTDKFERIAARASGGPVVKGRPYVVGEHGPELIVPDASGMVVNADGTRRMQRTGGGSGVAGGGGVTININVTGATDKVAVGREIAQALKAYQRSTGTDLGFA